MEINQVKDARIMESDLSIDEMVVKPKTRLTIKKTVNSEGSQIENVVSQTLDVENKVIQTMGSFDIGAKNLAVCVIDRLEGHPGFRIKQWKLISLVSNSGRSSAALKCKSLVLCRATKTKENCGLKATYWNPNVKVGYCKKHSPKDDPLIERYTTCKNISDFELNRKLVQELDLIPELIQCHEIVIESQMRSAMRKIADMIFSFLADRSLRAGSLLSNIRKVSASKKLKIPVDKLPISLPSGETDEYEDRKELAAKQCQVLISFCDQKWQNYFNQQKKQDDLADSFLQGMYFLLQK